MTLQAQQNGRSLEGDNMASKNVVLKDTFGNQIYPATTAEQIQYNASNNLKQMLDASISGLKIANTVSQMVDTDSAYIYTGSETGYVAGNWYYYKNSQWISGGTFGGNMTEITVSGTDPVITAEENTRYICGEVASIDFTPCATGICDILFSSGATATVLDLPQTVKLPEWFIVEANKTYEINILDGTYGAVMVWT